MKYSALFYGLALVGTVLLTTWGHMHPLWAWLICINLVAALAYVWDKVSAQTSAWRVSEYLLLGLGLSGGTIGALVASQLIRHKTSKGAFRLKFWLITGIQVLIIVGVWMFYPQIISWKPWTG